MPTMKEVRAKLIGGGASRKGLCNTPHPDPKYLEEAQSPVMDNRNGVIAQAKDDYGNPVYETVLAPSVKCSRFDGHDGDCSAYAFSITTPDTWPYRSGGDA